MSAKDTECLKSLRAVVDRADAKGLLQNLATFN